MPRDFPKTIDEQASHCFGCSATNPVGLQLSFEVSPEDATEVMATAVVRLTRNYEGPPGYLHGGIIATLMDEAMSKLNRPLNVIAMTRNLQVDYLRPCPVETPLTLTARHLRRDGRKLFHEASLSHPDGATLATAQGVFVLIDPSLIQRSQGLAGS